MIYVLFNSLANNHKGEENARKVLEGKIAKDADFQDLTLIKDIKTFVNTKKEDDQIILTGGDGTINHFVNEIEDEDIKCDILYCPSGSGNDFYTDVGPKDKIEPIKINKYIVDLPRVTVNGKDYKFVNGIGYGIDGYCCEIGDIKQRKSPKPVNYASIAIKGLLFFYKRTTVTVTVEDNEPVVIKRAWLAPTMKGRYYGGGMFVTPMQDRFDKDKNVTCMVMSGRSRLKTLIIFSKIFKGQHVKFEKVVKFFKGKTIRVEFDSPRALQIDGETLVGITSYTVHSK